MPGLNPIENLWHKMKHFICITAKPRNKEELLHRIQSFWVTVTPEKCCRYIHHLNGNRFKTDYISDGDSTTYNVVKANDPYEVQIVKHD